MTIENDTDKWMNATENAVTIDMGEDTYITSRESVKELLQGKREGVQLGRFKDE